MKTLTLLTLTVLLTAAIALTPATAQEPHQQWGLPEGATLRLGKGTIREIAYSPNGTLLAVASSIGIWLYDTATYDEVALLTGHTEPVDSLAFSPDGSTLASGSLDTTVRLWDAATGERLNTLTGHKNWVRSVAFSPDGTTLASGSRDGTVLLWPLAPSAATAVQIAADLNGDGVVTNVDLALVALRFGETGADIPADVNGDGLVDIEDLVLVAAVFGEAAAAAPAIAKGDIKPGHLQAADVQQWLREAKLANADPVGIAALERLLAALTRAEAPPKETGLLANYPNPFNPETWIPYQLAEPAEVTVSIYAADGKLVRTLALGQLPAGVYQNRSRAAYWDGRNAQGEPVASGVYFYTLQAGEFSATRKMLIRK